MRREWTTTHVSSDALASTLNKLEAQGWTAFAVSPTPCGLYLVVASRDLGEQLRGALERTAETYHVLPDPPAPAEAATDAGSDLDAMTAQDEAHAPRRPRRGRSRS